MQFKRHWIMFFTAAVLAHSPAVAKQETSPHEPFPIPVPAPKSGRLAPEPNPPTKVQIQRESFVKEVSTKIYDDWEPPHGTKNTAVVHISIRPDGYFEKVRIDRT